MDISVNKFCGKWLVLAIRRNLHGPGKDGPVFKVGLYDTQAQAICAAANVAVK